MGKTALGMCIALSGFSQERSLDHLIEQAQSLEMNGKFAEAERLFTQALHNAEESASTPLAVAGVLVNLAAVDAEQARYVDAERFLLRALALAQHAAGLTSPAAGCVIWRLIGVYADVGRLSLTNPLLRQYQTIAERNIGSDSLVAADMMGNLGRLYLARNDSRKALQLFQRAVEILEPHHEGNDMPIVRALLDRAAASGNLGLNADALSDIERATVILASLRGVAPQILIDLQVTSAIVYTRARRGPEAETCLKEALRIAEAHYGPDHPVVAFVLRNLDTVLRKFGQKQEAANCRKRARRIMAANNATSPLGNTVNAFLR